MPDCDRVPTELWHEILTGACIDGGFIGRSLALTNKFFHVQSLSTRFHSLSFPSLARVEAFLTFLDDQPKECNPKVQHLYLSFQQETELGKPSRDFWKTFSKWTTEMKEKHFENIEAEKEKWDMRFIAAMTRLFHLAGPHLRSLCILEGIRLRFPDIPIEPLPRLQELSLLGGYELFMLDKPSQKPSPGHPPFKFPSLQRLHCICVQWFKPSDILTYLSNRAPSSFTHLRFSGLCFDFSMYQFPVDLGRCLGVDVPPYGSRNETPTLINGLPSLRHVIVHGNPLAPGGWCGTNDGLWDDMCSHMQVVAQEVGDAKGVEMVQMSRPWRRNSRWPDRLRDDWMDRMKGRDGCWIRSEEEEILREVYEDDPPSPRSEPEDFADDGYGEPGAEWWYDREENTTGRDQMDGGKNSEWHVQGDGDDAGWGNGNLEEEANTGWYDI